MDIRIIVLVAWIITVIGSMLNQQLRKMGIAFISIASAVIVLLLVSVGEIAGMVATWTFK